MAELIAYTLLGDVEKEEGLGLNTMVIALDTQRFQTPTMMATAAAEILKEVREVPADVKRGFERVEVPGQRENERRRSGMRSGMLELPLGIWKDIVHTALRVGVVDDDLPKVTVKRSRL